MRQAQKDWAETARDTCTHWESSQGDQKSAGRAWKTLSLREKEALTPEATPGKGKERWQPLKSTAPEACPCLSWSLPVLGWCRALTPTEKGQGIPKCSGWWHRGGGRTVGLRGARRQQALLSTVLCSRTKDAAQRLHPGLPWRAPRCRPLVTQTQVMTSATSIPWDSPQARSLLSPLPFLPHQRVSGCPSDSNSEKRQEAAEDLF